VDAGKLRVLSPLCVFDANVSAYRRKIREISLKCVQSAFVDVGNLCVLFPLCVFDVKLFLKNH
jgi:hypothetical protein